MAGGKKNSKERLETLERYSGRATLLILVAILGEIIGSVWFPNRERSFNIECNFLIAIALIVEYICIIRTIVAANELQRESDERVSSANENAAIANQKAKEAELEIEKLKKQMAGVIGHVYSNHP